jgi:hypothetical protein
VSLKRGRDEAPPRGWRTNSHSPVSRRKEHVQPGRLARQRRAAPHAPSRLFPLSLFQRSEQFYGATPTTSVAPSRARIHLHESTHCFFAHFSGSWAALLCAKLPTVRQTRAASFNKQNRPVVRAPALLQGPKKHHTMHHSIAQISGVPARATDASLVLRIAWLPGRRGTATSAAGTSYSRKRMVLKMERNNWGSPHWGWRAASSSWSPWPRWRS